ncbi:hypothetical protein [Streptomyces chartreusis]|uniref:hypothetical protein n=1 Tax=Streptomyces chartreusis TaxID=1969 RepID=UPI0037DC4D6E|nr:hypothetical protein OG938_48090 [Streptomyces chartreusis]
MSQWNLSVRLTGQGSDLSRTLQDLASDARDASRDINALRLDIEQLRQAARNDIRIRLDVDGDHLRADVTAALNSAGSGQGLQARLDLDSAHLRDDVSTALTAAGAGQGLGVNLRVADPMQLRREVSDAVRWASMGQRIDIPIGLADPMQLRRDVSDAVRWASMNQTITVRVDPDTSALNGLTGTLAAAGAAASSSSSSGGLLATLLLLSPAIIPLTTVLAPLPGILAASGAGMTAFGIAVAGQIGPLSELTEAEQKYEEAVREHGRGSAEAAKAQMQYQSQLAQMPAETQEAAASLSVLKDSYRQWSDSLSGDTMQPVIHSLSLMDALLPHLTPQVQTASRELDRMITLAGGAVATPGFDAASKRFDDFTDRTLDSMGDKLVHVLRLLSEGSVDGPLSSVIDYIRANGDEARETLGNIGDAVGNLFEGAAEAGPTMLTLVNAVAKLVSAVPPEVVGTLIQLAAALKLVQLAGLGAAAISAGVAALGARIAALQAASVAAGGGMAGLAAAFATLGKAAKASIIIAGIGALVYAVSKLSDIGEKAPPNVDKLTTSLGKLGASGKVTGEAAAAFGKDFGKLREQIDKVTDPSVAESINNWGADVSNGILDAGDATEEFEGSMKAIDESLTNLVKGGKADLAKAALENITKGMSPEQAAKIRDGVVGTKAALADLVFEQELAAQAMGPFSTAAQEVSATLGAQKGAVDGLRASILALNETNRSAHDAQTQFGQAMDDLTASFKEHGATLDRDTDAGRRNREAMSAASKAQDELIATGIAAGDSFESLTKQSGQLRSEMMRLAVDAFDGNKKKATEYVNTLLGTPETVKTVIRMEKEQAERGLEEVNAAIKATPNAHTVEVSTLNAAAIAALEAVGLKTRQLPDGRTEVYTANGQSLGSINAVARAIQALDGQTAHVYTIHHYKNITEGRTGLNTGKGGRGANAGLADGAVVDYYADGGMRRENHVAQIARGGTWRVWAEDETQGEGYVPFARSKRVRSRAITEEIVRRLGGDPAGIAWNANGSVTDWRYDPQTGSLYSPSDAGSAGNKTRKVKGKEISYFDLGAVESKIRSASRATMAWNADLQKVADRVGGDVAEALASMGKEGVKLADKMANGSTKYINEMAAALRNLQKVAKASLTDYTRQLGNANKLNKDFADDLAKLAAMGYGDLAAQLAEQNDTAAQQLADAASKDKGKAAKANAAAKTANNALTAEQVQDLVQIIAAIKTNKTGIHDVAATTGLGEDVIIDVANKAKSQISKSLGSRASRFLSDLTKANRHMAYADGGIRAGMYATQAGIIRFAEPETRGEAFIPLGENKRRSAMPVLADVAHRFGVGLTDGRSGRPLVIVRSGDTINVPVTNANQNASPSDIGAQVGYQFRRAKRGGVSSRAVA